MIFLSLLFVNCKSEKKTQDFGAITDAYFDGKNELDPLGATQNGQKEYNDKLVFEMTDSYRKKQAAFFDKFENELTTVDTTALSTEEKNSYDIIKWEVSVGKDLLKYDTNLMPVQQFWGTHLTMGQFAGGKSAQPFKTEKDYKNFLKRMDLFSVWIDSAMVYMKKGIDKGMVLPKALTVKVIPQFESMVTPNVENNLFYSAVKSFPKEITTDQQEALKKEYATTIKEKLEPQFKKMTAFLKNEYLPASRNSSGIGSLPNGAALYKVYVKQWTTTTKTPEEIHALGLKEVARIKAEMEKVKDQVGFKGTLETGPDRLTNTSLCSHGRGEPSASHDERIRDLALG